MHIAIVEDAPDVAMLLEIFLTAESDHTVTLLTSRFRDLCNDDVWMTVDVVVCDLQLGDYRGSDLLRCLKLRYPRIRRVMLTGSASVTEAEVHAHQVLIKPAPPALVRKAVENVD